jgi:SulP family sulfate permease
VTFLFDRKDFNFSRRSITKDVVAGFTVAIVALPLAIGFGITSGMSAAAGLTTAIIAGFLAALFGGSRFQVSGPTGAMTVVLVPIIHSYGVGAIPLLGILAGAMVIVMALLKLGKIINRVPWAVVEGFTVGIACVIALQQLPLALGVAKGSGDRSLPIAFNTIRAALSASINWNSLLVVAITIFVKFIYPKVSKRVGIRAHIPASFVAIVIALIVTKTFALDIASIGDIPRSVGGLNLNGISLGMVSNLLWPAFLIALLCAIESLLSARVADGMAHVDKTHHYQPNRELFGQGLGTAVASIFGGMPATGAIARTSVNVRAHAQTRLASIIHSFVLLFVVLVAAPVVSAIPSAAIAGVLIGTSYRILNPASIRESLQTTKSEAIVLITTAISTLVIDLIWGIAIGIILHLILSRTKLS